jgi:hypothetical protein
MDLLCVLLLRANVNANPREDHGAKNHAHDDLVGQAFLPAIGPGTPGPIFSSVIA